MAGRFFRPGVSKFRFATAVANIAAPSRAEINASVALSNDIAEITGFSLTNSPIPVPDLGTDFTANISGEDTVADSSLTFYDDDTTTIRTALAKGTAGYVLYFPYGDVATKRMETWPVRTSGVNDIVTRANEAAKFNVPFAITSRPNLTAVVPA